MKKMLFIINPRSGKEQIRSRLLEILDSFVKAGYGPSVYITQGPKDAEYQAARAKTKELVVCSGGDGTLNEVVSGLMTITPEKRPELGYIPSGSTNDFASSLGLPKNMNNTEDVHIAMNKIDTLYANAEQSFAGQLIVDYSSKEADRVLNSMYKESVNSEKYSQDNLVLLAEKGMQISKIFMENAKKTKKMFINSMENIQ